MCFIRLFHLLLLQGQTGSVEYGTFLLVIYMNVSLFLSLWSAGSKTKEGVVSSVNTGEKKLHVLVLIVTSVK